MQYVCQRSPSFHRHSCSVLKLFTSQFVLQKMAIVVFLSLPPNAAPVLRPVYTVLNFGTRNMFTMHGLPIFM